MHGLLLGHSLVAVPAYVLGIVFCVALYPTACSPDGSDFYFTSGSNMLLMGAIAPPIMLLVLLGMQCCWDRCACGTRGCKLWLLALPNGVATLAVQTLATIQLHAAGCLDGEWRNGQIIACLVGQWLLWALTLGVALWTDLARRPAAYRVIEDSAL
jgi:hypothetical protein